MQRRKPPSLWEAIGQFRSEQKPRDEDLPTDQMDTYAAALDVIVAERKGESGRPIPDFAAE